MEGALEAEKKRLDVAMYTAWHTAIFGLNGYAGKLKGKLSDYLISERSEPQVNTKAAEAIAFFHRMKAAGVPVEITRNQIN